MADLLEIVKTLTVVELQSELRSRGLKKSGNKAELIKRLEQYIIENVKVSTENEEPLTEKVKDDNLAADQSTDKGSEARDYTEELTKPIHTASSKKGERLVDMKETKRNVVKRINEGKGKLDEEPVSPTFDTQNNFKTFNASPKEHPVDIPGEKESEETQENIDNDFAQEKEAPITSVLHESQSDESNTAMKEDDPETDEERHKEEEKVEDQEEMNDDPMQGKEEEEGDDDGEAITTSKRDDDEDNEISVHEEDVELVDDDIVVEIDKDKEKEEEPIVAVKEKTKPIKPVMLKKVQLNAQTNETSEERTARRKRRWGSTAVKKPSVTISSDSLKKFISDVKVDASDLENILPINADAGNDVEVEEDTESQNDGMESPKKKGRTVKVDSAKTIVLTGDKQANEEEAVFIESDSEKILEKKRQNSSSVLSDSREKGEKDNDEGKNAPERSPSPPKNSPSQFIHIDNLVRPFTILQLKNLISKTSTICENGFWINSIKSHCYVKLSSEEEAMETRKNLHGLKWPSGNPKVLKVDFAEEEKIYKQTDGTLGEKPKVVVQIDDDEEKQESKDKNTDPKRRGRERKTSEKSRDNKDKNKEKSESPAKLLDDLFRKTKATPSIYWLPLSDEEVLKRKKEKERETQIEKDRPSNREISNRRSRRRSPSPNRRQDRHLDRRRPTRNWR